MNSRSKREYNGRSIKYEEATIITDVPWKKFLNLKLVSSFKSSKLSKVKVFVEAFALPRAWTRGFGSFWQEEGASPVYVLKP